MICTGRPPSDAGSNTHHRNQLFGRNHEIESLCDALRSFGGDSNDEKGLTHATPRLSTDDSTAPRIGLVLLSGPRGVGKRALMETCMPSMPTDVLFLSGRFPRNDTHGETAIDDIDSSRLRSMAPSPFRVLLDAMEQITLHVDSTTLERMRTFVAQRLEPSDREVLTQFRSCTLIRALVPDRTLDSIPVPITTASMAPPFGDAGVSRPRHNDPCAALARLWRVVSTCTPIVLHLEHLQWADDESLQVIQLLVRSDGTEQSTAALDGTQGLLIVASYRDDTVTNRERLVPFLRGVTAEDCGPRLWRIPLTNMSRSTVDRWIQCGSRVAPNDERRRSWVDFVFGISAGNPLHVQLISEYVQETGRIQRDDKELDALCRELPTDIDSLLRRTLVQLPRDLRDVVEIAAAIGHGANGSFDFQVLEMVLQRPCEASVAELRNCHVLELDGEERLRFYRPELQTLAYSMIAESNRAAVHLKIGRRMWKNSPLGTENEIDDDGRRLGLVAHQLFRGLHLVSDNEERNVIAVTHFRVGKQAMYASNFTTAVAHFEIAKTALGNLLWSSERYEISLLLCNCLAEALYCTGEFEEMENTLNNILRMASSFQDKLLAYTTFVFTNAARHRLKEAVNMALEVLEQLGEPIASNPSFGAVMLEYVRVRRMIRGKKDRYFLSLPPATNADKIAAMQMLNFTFFCSYVVNPKVGALAAFRMMRLTMIHGMTGPGSTGFSAFSLLLNGLGRIEESYRFGQIALELLDRLGGKAWVARIYVVVHGLINPCFRPLRDSLVPLQYAHQSALATGDIEGSMLAAATFVSMSFSSGVPLGALERDTISYCKLMDSLSQTSGLLFVVPMWHLFCSLSGTSMLTLDLTGPVTDSNSARSQAVKEGHRLALSMQYGLELVRCCYLGAFDVALAMAEKSREYTLEVNVRLIFYQGLVALSLARNDSMWSFRRKKHVSVGLSAARQVKRWARLCPANARNKQLLLDAELATLRGESTKAMFLFNESIKEASREGFIHEEGLAYERLAHYHCYLGHSHTAALYFECARDAYETWGAHVLVQRMDVFMAALPSPRNKRSTLYRSRTFSM